MINLETEIVASRYDAKAGTSYFTVERNARRWTVGVPDADIARLGGNKQARRAHISGVLETAMRGRADGEA